MVALRRFGFLLLVGLGLVPLVVGSLLADYLETTGGKRFEGTIRQEGESYVVVRPNGTSMTFPKGIVKEVVVVSERRARYEAMRKGVDLTDDVRVGELLAFAQRYGLDEERAKLLADAYARRREAAGDRTDAWRRLAKWCERHGLKTEGASCSRRGDELRFAAELRAAGGNAVAIAELAKRCRGSNMLREADVAEREALRIAPEDPKVRTLLGYLRGEQKGKWVRRIKYPPSVKFLMGVSYVRAYMGVREGEKTGKSDVRVSEDLIVTDVPVDEIRLCLTYAEAAYRGRMLARAKVPSERWLVESWMEEARRGERVSGQALIRMDARLSREWPAAKTEQLGIEWLLFPFDRKEWRREPVPLRSLLERFDPERPVTAANAHVAAEELLWTKEMRLSDGSYTSLPRARTRIQIWLLEAMGFSIGNVNHFDPARREKALQQLTDAKASFAATWEGRASSRPKVRPRRPRPTGPRVPAAARRGSQPASDQLMRTVVAFLDALLPVAPKPITRTEVETMLNAAPEVRRAGGAIPADVGGFDDLVKKFEAEARVKDATARHRMTPRSFLERYFIAQTAAAVVEAGGPGTMDQAVVWFKEKLSTSDPEQKRLLAAMASMQKLYKAIPPQTYEAVRPHTRQILELPPNMD